MKQYLNEIDLIDALGNLWHEPGEETDLGCHDGAVPYLINNLQKKSDKKYRVVRRWVVLDIDVDEEVASLMRARGVKPCMLKADFLVEDSEGEFTRGSWVTSSVLVDLHRNCVFETQNTYYILLGAGRRMTIEYPLAAYLLKIPLNRPPTQ